MKNVCIVGYGAIGPIHATALSKLDNVNLYAVCDVDKSATARCLDEYDVVCYNDYDAMLSDRNIDVVHICTPHYLHYEMITKALEHHLGVVCEKPVAMTRNEFDKLLEFKGSDAVCVVMQNRYNNCIHVLKDKIENGDLGEIHAIKGLVTWHRDESYYMSGDWRGKWSTEGGGVLINQAVHTLDLLVYLAGNISHVEASMANHSLKNIIETEDTVEAYLHFEKDFNGIFYATNTYPGGVEIEIAGDNTRAVYMNKKLIINDEFVAEDKAPDGGKDYWGSGHEALFKDYYYKNKFFSPHDIQNTMHTLFSIYESAKCKKEIEIK